MYKSFEANNFRCFRRLRLDDLERINLIAGPNNTGKTALLEALFLYGGAYNPTLALHLNALRGIDIVKIEFGQWAETPWTLLFNEFDTLKNITLSGKAEGNGQRTLQLKIIRKPEELEKISQDIKYDSENESKNVISAPEAMKYTYSSDTTQVLELICTEGKQRNKYYLILDQKGFHTKPIPPPPPFPTLFMLAQHYGVDAERFGKLQTAGKKDVLLNILKIIEPRLTSIEMVIVGGKPIIHGDIGLNRLMPLPIMGQGITRLASLILNIGNAPKGVVLVDEIENGIHHSVLPKIWRAIGQAARDFDTQVFATTHSLECIAAAHKAFAESKNYDFRLHRLERINGEIKPVTYDKKLLEAAIETGLEVR